MTDCCMLSFVAWVKDEEIIPTYTSAGMSETAGLVLFTRRDCPVCGKSEVWVSGDAMRAQDEEEPVSVAASQYGA